MQKAGWPGKGTAGKILAPLCTIAVDYKKHPVRIENEMDTGYCIKSVCRRKSQLSRMIENTRREIYRAGTWN